MNATDNRPKPPVMSRADEAIINEAIAQLQDLIMVAWQELDQESVSVLEQVAWTREAVSSAMKVVTKYRAKAVKAGHT